MKIIVICAFRDFYLPVGTSVNVHKVTLTTDKSKLNTIFDQDMRQTIGEYDFAHFEKEDCAWGYLNGISNEPITDINESFTTLAMSIKDSIEAFLHCLWFAKDTSAYLFNFIAYCPENDMIYKVPSSHPFVAISQTKESQSFSIEEINKVVEIRKQLKEIKGAHFLGEENAYKISKDGYRSASINQVVYSETNRIYRAILFLNYARDSGFLIMKIAMYVPLLESLFSSGNTEVTHKVAERCSHFVGGNTEEKIETYDLVSIVYDIRSKFLHGSTLSKKKVGGMVLTNHETQIAICHKIDMLARKILIKAIMDDSEIFLDEQKHSEYFKRILFS